MMDENRIEQLLETFYMGNTTLEEEKLLFYFFNNNTIPEKWHSSRDVFNVLYNSSEIPLPEGITQRFEKAIDKHIEEKSLKKNNIKLSSLLTKKKIIIGIMSMAAVALICMILFVNVEKQSGAHHHIADTYTNPEEAAKVAEQTLILVSSKLNKGLNPIEKVKESVDKTNELLNENFKLN